MGKFNKVETVKGKFTGVVVKDNELVDAETGEVIDIIKILGQIYNDDEFDISTSSKNDVELNPKTD